MCAYICREKKRLLDVLIHSRKRNQKYPKMSISGMGKQIKAYIYNREKIGKKCNHVYDLSAVFTLSHFFLTTAPSITLVGENQYAQSTSDK